MCFIRQHFVLLAFNPTINSWVQFDDTTVKPVGTWADLCEFCKKGGLQPLVLFYERF
jgi:hypothetical protein